MARRELLRARRQGEGDDGPVEEAVRVVVLKVPVYFVQDSQLLRLDLLDGERILHARAQRRHPDRDRA